MPLRWEELIDPRALAFTPDRAVERLRRLGDLFRPVLELRQPLPAPA